MKFKFLFLFAFLSGIHSYTQELQPLEPIKNHYKILEKLSSSPKTKFADLDSLRFAASNYNAVALLYTMVTPYYLKQQQVKELKESFNFPANSSDQTKAELEYLLDWQEKRTEEQEYRTAKVLAPIGYWPHLNIKNDHEEYQQNIKHLFFEGESILGETCSFENYPATGKLLAGITLDMRIMEFSLKYHLLRIRPYDLDTRLNPLQIMGSPSFASGHTLWAYLHALTWSELQPAKRNQFLDLAYEIAESREIMGIHYPSDNEASRKLAYKMLQLMWENPKFKADFKEAQKEWQNRIIKP